MTTGKRLLLYEDIIKPILNNNCYSCHGSKKTKGALDLHTKDGILKGGENGTIIEGQEPKESSLYSKLILPKEDDEHMPPKDKTQPSKEEIELVKIWIENGNPFDKTVGELGLPKKLFLDFFPKILDKGYPEHEITPASQDSIVGYKVNRNSY